MAQNICSYLEKAGAEVIGPIPAVSKALAKRQVPFVFTTGHDQSALPESYRHILHCETPVDMSVMVSMIGRALKG